VLAPQARWQLRDEGFAFIASMKSLSDDHHESSVTAA
jgi:hypothetical protein